MEFVSGRVFWDPTLPQQSKQERGAIYDQMNEVLAAIHSVDIANAGLSDFGRPGSYYERQFTRWSTQYRASETELVEEMEELIEWLGDHVPEDDGKVCLVHGDYRIDNIMFASSASQAIAVMDWELATLGHPFADLAYQCMLWRWSDQSVMKGLGGKNLKDLGIPSEEDYVAQYCQRVGLPGIRNWDFYIAFGAFRLAAITQGVRKRNLAGNASSQLADQVGALARPLAKMGLDACLSN